MDAIIDTTLQTVILMTLVAMGSFAVWLARRLIDNYWDRRCLTRRGKDNNLDSRNRQTEMPSEPEQKKTSEGTHKNASSS